MLSKELIINLTVEAVSEFWSKKVLEAGEIHVKTFFSILDAMPLTMSEKDYYKSRYTKVLKRKLTESLPPEKQEHFKNEIKKKVGKKIDEE
jgi:hypothetical protein